MTILVDMNLSPRWVDVLVAAGHDAVHWSTVGAPDAPDPVLMAWARDRRAVVFTNDLDFSAILAASGGRAPSVLQLRAQDLMPGAMGRTVLAALAQFRADLDAGALVTLDARRGRARKLPL